MEASPDYAVQMHGITKTFGSFKALDGVDLDVKKQTVHAILGENGAGKSTLMNVLYGLYQADEGEVYLGGQSVQIQSPLDAIAHGIGMSPGTSCSSRTSPSLGTSFLAMRSAIRWASSTWLVPKKRSRRSSTSMASS